MKFVARVLLAISAVAGVLPTAEAQNNGIASADPAPGMKLEGSARAGSYQSITIFDRRGKAVHSIVCPKAPQLLPALMRDDGVSAAVQAKADNLSTKDLGAFASECSVTARQQ